jgi:NAD/NADP transhydrogenase alpha subunit
MRNLTASQINVVVISPTSPTRPHPETGPPPSLDQIKPGDIAISLALIEGDCYNKITEVDYIAHLRGVSITKHIESATSINNRLVNWVKMKIVR